MKYLIKDLSPGKTYYFQFRSKASDGSVSEWSRTFSISTTGDIYPPNAPTGLTLVTSGRSFQAAWTAPTNSTDGNPATDLRHYLVKVESSLAPGVSKTYVTADTKFEVTFERNLETFTTARGTIGVSVAAQDMTGNIGAYTSVVTASNPAPTSVAGLVVTPGIDQIALGWNPNTEEDLKHYEVHRSKTGVGGTYTKIWTGTTTQFIDTTVDYFTDHWYKVYAVDVFNTLSTATTSGSAARPVGSFVVDATAPPVPTGLAATLTNATDGKTASAAVSWSAVVASDLAEYVVGYKPSASGDWQYTTVDYSLTSTLINGLLPYVNYDFRVRAADWMNNFSAWSSTLTKTATANAAPATVTGVVMTATDNTATIYWTENTEPDVINGAGMYLVDLATNSGFTTGLLSYKTGSTNITVTGLPPATAYWVRVKAVDSLGLASASWSATTGTTTITMSNAPSNFKYWPPSGTAPSSPSVGDLWMDTTTGFEKQWSGSVWVVTGNVTASYSAAKGTDLIVNGTGSMGNNYNFSLYTFSGSDAPNGAAGSFDTTLGSLSGLLSDEFIPIDPTKSFAMSVAAKQKSTSTTARTYVGLAFYDATKTAIVPNQVMYFPNTTTTLAVDLVNGATTVTLTSAANWNNAAGANSHYRSFIFWDYTDAFGKLWPIGTMSRNYTAANIYPDGGISGNVITLNAPWAGGTKLAGTPISEGSSGGTYAYMPSLSNTIIPQTWTSYRDVFPAGVYVGNGTAGPGFTTGWPSGIAYVKVISLPNRTVGGTADAASKHSFATLSLSDTTAAQMTADGKNKIIRSLSDASGTTGFVANDLWWKLDGSGNVIKQWKYSGSAWVVEVLMDGVFGSLSANKLVAGSAFVTDLSIGTGGNIKSAGYTSGGTSGFILNETGLTIKGTNNVVDAGVLKGGVITGTTINVGVGGTLNVDSTGVIKSNNYSVGSTGYQLSNAGLELNDGVVDAKTLKTGTAVIGDLTIGRSADALGSLKSFGYTAGVTGFKLDKTGLEINDGTIQAKTLSLQIGENIAPMLYGSFEADGTTLNNECLKEYAFIGTQIIQKVTGTQSMNQFWTVTATVGQRSKVWFGKTNTNYNTRVESGTTYILSIWVWPDAVRNINLFVKDSAGTVTNVYSGSPAASTWTRISGTWTAPSGVNYMVAGVDSDATAGTNGTVVGTYFDAYQIEEKFGSLNTPSTWTPPGLNTTITGGLIRTGAITSNTVINVSGIDLPKFSINTDGNMQVGDALIRGKLVVGTTSEAPLNRAPGNGDFESNVTGYSTYASGGATGLSISRTTVPAEIINGTGSAKIIAAAGTKTRLGLQWNTSLTYTEGARITVTAKIRVNTTDAGSTIKIAAWDAGLNILDAQDIITNPLLNTTYDLRYEYVVDTGQAVTLITIGHAGTAITSTMVLVDDIVLNDDLYVGNSYVTSPDYQRGSTGWRIDGAGNAEFNDGVFRGTLGANMVDAEQMVSEIVMASTFKTAKTGRRVEFDGDGISMYESDESLLVNLPTNTDSPAMFNGDLLATSLTISDSMAIRGSNNALAKNATLTIESGTTAPVSPPTVQVGYEQIDFGTDSVFAPYKFGLAYSVATSRFMFVQNIYNSNAGLVYLSTTGVQDWTSTTLRDIRAEGSVMVWGGEIYVLGKDINGAWKIEVRNETTKAWVRTFATGNSYNYRAAIGNDGTYVTVTYGANSNHVIYLTKFNKTTGALISNTSSNYAMSGGNYNITGAGYIPSGTSGGFSTSRYWFTRDNMKTVYVLDSAFQAFGNGEEFTSPNNIRGATFADIGGGNQFFTFDNVSGKVTKHTGVSWVGTATSSSKWHVTNTWYDNNATGGVHETNMGPVTSFTMIKRAALTVTSAPIPVRPIPNTNDDPVAVGFYMARNAGTLTGSDRALFEFQAYTATGVKTLYLHRNGGPSTNLPVATVNATVPPPSTNGFIGVPGSPGQIRSSNDIINLNGDGSGKWGDLVVSNTGVTTMTNRLPTMMKVGTYTQTTGLATGTSANTSVSFGITFPSAPRVVMTSENGRYTTGISSVTTTGFIATVANWSGASAPASIPVHWIAIL